jgi:hypothetical protein
MAGVSTNRRRPLTGTTTAGELSSSARFANSSKQHFRKE